MSGRAPFNHLIYPVPMTGGSGIHLTFDLGGQARFGPDVQWVTASTMTSIPTAPAPSMRRSAGYGPAFPMAC